MILKTLLGNRRLSSYRDEAFWNRTLGIAAQTTAGVQVNQDTALNFSAVYRAVALIAGTTARLPLHVYRGTGQGRVRIRDNNLDRLLNKKANPATDSFSFRETLTIHMLTWGNGYAEVTRDPAGHAVSLTQLNPSQTKPVITDEGQLEYEWRPTAGEAIRYQPDRILHVKNFSVDGITGQSVIRRAKESIGLGMATETYGAGLFGNAARPGGVLQHPGKLSDPAKNFLRTSWEQMHKGPDNAHRVAILEEGMTWQNMSIPPEDAQFLQTRKFQIEEIARWFGIPGHFLGLAETAANTEQKSLEWLIYGLAYWLEKWEVAVNLQLIDMDGVYAEHQNNALFKADTTTRYNAYSVARNNGWMSINDIRERENLPGIGPGGDVYLMPANMVPVDSALQQQQPPQSEGPPPTPPAAPPEPSQAPNPTPTPKMQSAVRGILIDAWKRLAIKETKAALQAAKKPAEFLNWLDSFYAKHEQQLAEAITPGLAMAVEIGGNRSDANRLSASWCEFSRLALLDASGEATAKNLPDVVGEIVSDWDGVRVLATVSQLTDFDESKHKRAGDGKFTSGGGSSSDSKDDNEGEEPELTYDEAYKEWSEENNKLESDVERYDNLKQASRSGYDSAREYTDTINEADWLNGEDQQAELYGAIEESQQILKANLDNTLSELENSPKEKERYADRLKNKTEKAINTAKEQLPELKKRIDKYNEFAKTVDSLDPGPEPAKDSPEHPAWEKKDIKHTKAVERLNNLEYMANVAIQKISDAYDRLNTQYWVVYDTATTKHYKAENKLNQHRWFEPDESDYESEDKK